VPERVLVSLLLVAALADIACTQTTITRDEIAEHLKEHVILTPRLEKTLADTDKDAFVAQVQQRVTSLAREVLPPTLSVPGTEDVKEIFPALLVDAGNKELTDLLIRKKLMDVRITVGFMKECTPPSREVTSKITANLDHLVQGMRESVNQHIAKDIAPGESDPVLDAFRSKLAAKIGSRVTYAMKIPCAAEVLDRFLEEFDRRVADSADRVAARLAEANHEQDPVKAEQLRQRIVQAILAEILLRPSSFLMEATTDPRLASLDPEIYASGYRDLLRRIRELESQERSLRDLEKLRREEERREAKYRELVDSVSESSIESATANLPSPVDLITEAPADTTEDSGVREVAETQAKPAKDESVGEKSTWWVLSAVPVLLLIALAYLVRHRYLLRRSMVQAEGARAEPNGPGLISRGERDRGAGTARFRPRGSRMGG
jgi:hypothetical protein